MFIEVIDNFYRWLFHKSGGHGLVHLTLACLRTLTTNFKIETHNVLLQCSHVSINTNIKVVAVESNKFDALLLFNS